MRKNKKKRTRTLTYQQVNKAAFFCREMREAGAAKLEFGFIDKNDKLIAHIYVWDDPKDHGDIVRWFDGRYYFHPYKISRGKPYTMTLAKFKYLKSRLA